MPTKLQSDRRPLAVILRVLLAAVFVVSALAKLFAIDSFELYVFSYAFFSLNTTYILVRLCIGAEFLLGVMIATGWLRRWINLTALAMLLFFSLFLCYAALAGHNESCQCFGQLADMPPAVSLLKNAVLILMVLLYMKLSKEGSPLSRWQLIATIVIALASIVIPFVVSVPDNWWFGPEEGYYDKELLDETVRERHLDKGHKLVAFVTPGCPYCKMTRSKLSSIALRHDIDSFASYIYIEPTDLDSNIFVKITYGQRPLVLLLDNGQPITTYHYRNINERQVADFLKGGSINPQL